MHVVLVRQHRKACEWVRDAMLLDPYWRFAFVDGMSVGCDSREEVAIEQAVYSLTTISNEATLSFWKEQDHSDRVHCREDDEEPEDPGPAN
jgi:hypothetical protein